MKQSKVEMHGIEFSAIHEVEEAIKMHMGSRKK